MLNIRGTHIIISRGPICRLGNAREFKNCFYFQRQKQIEINKLIVVLINRVCVSNGLTTIGELSTPGDATVNDGW